MEHFPHAPILLEQRPYRRIDDSYLQNLGQLCASAVPDPEVLAWHNAAHAQPNSANGKVFPFLDGDIPTEPDRVYRQVGIEALEDLAQCGIVRNGATARGREHPRWGHRVFWSQGTRGNFINVAERAVLTAPAQTARAGWITTPQLTAIYVKNSLGEIQNILRTD